MYFKIISIVAVSSLLIACDYSATPQSTPAPQSTAKADVTVEITKDGFSPASITINKDQTVEFVNRDSALHWPASAMHPTHSLYPTKGGCIGSTFDACRGLRNGEKFVFTFDQVGTWKYHDHLNITKFGSIEVK